MFEQAGAIDAANEIRRDGDRVAALTQTVLSPEVVENPVADTQLPILFDIPSIFDEMVSLVPSPPSFQHHLTPVFRHGTKNFQH